LLAALLLQVISERRLHCGVVIEAQSAHGMISQPVQSNNIVVSNFRISTQRSCRSLLGKRLQLLSALDCRQQQRIRISVETETPPSSRHQPCAGLPRSFPGTVRHG
jgi:hypothetical protein